MDDRRRLPRKYLLIYSRVFERMLGKLLGYLADLSEEGAMIIAEEPLTVGETLSLRFDLPDPKVFETHNLYLTAQVARCGEDISPKLYDIGFKFLDVTPEQKAVIQKMMEVYEFQRGNQAP